MDDLSPRHRLAMTVRPARAAQIYAHMRIFHQIVHLSTITYKEPIQNLSKPLTSTALGHDSQACEGSAADADDDGCACLLWLLPPGFAGISGSRSHHLQQCLGIGLGDHRQQLPQQQQLAAQQGRIQRFGLRKWGVAAGDCRARCTI